MRLRCEQKAPLERPGRVTASNELQVLESVWLNSHGFVHVARSAILTYSSHITLEIQEEIVLGRQPFIMHRCACPPMQV